MEKKLGRIKKCVFGHGGYQDAMIGITFDLGGEGWGVGDFWGHWAGKRSESCAWTEQDRINEMGKIALRLGNLLSEAKVTNIYALKDVPIEVTFDGNLLKSWRVLKEVI